MQNGEPVSVWGHSPTRGGKDEWVKVEGSTSIMDRALLDAVATLIIERDMHTFTVFSHLNEQDSFTVRGTWVLNPAHFGDDLNVREIAYGLILCSMDEAKLI